MNPYTYTLALLTRLRRLAVRASDGRERGFSYLRFSDPKQQLGDSVRRQLEAKDAWFRRHPEVVEDNTLKIRDRRNVSGFTAKHRVDPRYVLAQIKAHVDKGNIPAGSYLVVENLDRLSREHWTDALPWCLELIQKGIRIVQLFPTEIVYDSGMDQGRLMLMLLELGRAHSESKMKSERVGAAWRAKKQAARERVPFGAKVPAWLDLADGKYQLRPGAARLVRKIFHLAREGYGHKRIVRHLVSSLEEPFAGARWGVSYIAKILRWRAVIGEYQPMMVREGKRVPDGDPIPNYYPAAVSEAEFYAAQHSQDARRQHGGRPAKTKGHQSPFTGLLRCANDGAKLYVRSIRGRPMLYSRKADDGDPDACALYFFLDHFVDPVRLRLRELTGAALFNDPGAAQVDEIKGRLRDVERRLAVAVERFNADRESTTWADQIDKLDATKRALNAELRDAQQTAATPISSTWSEAVELMHQNEPARLRQCLLETVEDVWLLIVARGRFDKLGAVQVRFVGGGRREYLILSHNPRGMKARTEKGKWVARQLSEKVPGSFDLRDKKHVAKLTRLLEAIDLTTF